MTDEFTAWCTQYYRLTTLFAPLYERYKNLLDNAPRYTGQHSTNQVDDMMSYGRKAEATRLKGAKMFKDLTETGRTIVGIMRHFEIPPRTVLTGQIPGELEYEIWANEKDDLFIGKIRNLPQEADNPNMITIKCWTGDKDKEDD